MRSLASSRARWSALSATVLTSALVLSLAPAATAAPPGGVLASGDDWSITSAPGGYLVSYELDEPLPIVSDAPTLLVDGETIGLATESADGLILSVSTSDSRVVSAHDVEKGWASGGGDKAAESPTARTSWRTEEGETAPQATTFSGADDPADPGPNSVTEVEYDFGDRAIALQGIGGIRGEMTGKMYLTDAPGERPTVILLHGRHAWCATGTANALRWPCDPSQVNVRSYQGYEGTGRALASHGYNVVSIAANAINANDNQFALDFGARARGQLVLDTLDMLAAVDAGRPVSYDDVSWPDAQGSSTTVTRTLDQALAYATTRTDAPATAAAGVTAASLAGRFDLDDVGIMGHSRGGEGVTAAVTLNAARTQPFHITAVLPLAPVDFGRMTVPDVPMSVVLPYCDGDVVNQQGQHFVDDSRHAFGDDVLRSAVWVMGANHNFFNSVWTPGLYPYSTGDDWSTKDLTSSCSTTDSTRLTAAAQYQVGVSYMTGFFRMTMGHEKQFQSLFDGSIKPSTPRTSSADVRVMAAQPGSATSLVTDFASASTLVRTTGAASAQVCANAETSSSIPPAMPYCTTRDIGSARVPHWTPARFGLNVEATPVTRFVWTGGTDPAAPSTGELRVSLPPGSRDVSKRSQLTVKMAPDRTVPSGTDAVVSLVDGSGRVFSRAVSDINPLAVNRMPGGSQAVLNKFVLQQVTVPLAQVSGIDLTDVREVRFSAAVGADGTGAGGLYLSDLAFDTPTSIAADVRKRTTVGVGSTIVEETDGPSTAQVAVALNHPDSATVTAWFSVLGTGVVSSASQKVVFAPGEICKTVTVPLVGNDTPSATPTSSFVISATNSTDAVMGADAFGKLSVREDDGVTGDSPELAPVGAQGDACAELAAALSPGQLSASETEVAPGGAVTLTGSGFRPGETVRFTLAGQEIASVVADASGTATVEVDIPADAALGVRAAEAEGEGSGRLLDVDIAVLTPTSTTVALDDGSTLTAGGALSFTATVDGASEGTVHLVVVPAADDPDQTERVLASATLVDGSAQLDVPDGLPAGTYVVKAVFDRTDTASASASEPLSFTVADTPGPGDGGGSPSSGAPAGTGGAASGNPAPAAQPAGDQLARTGTAEVWAMLVIAAGLLGAGAFAVVIRRRRQGVDPVAREI